MVTRPRKRCGRMQILSILDEIFCDVDNQNLIRHTLQDLLNRDPEGFIQLFWMPLLPKSAFTAPALKGQSNEYAELSLTEQIALDRDKSDATKPPKHTKPQLPAGEQKTLEVRTMLNTPELRSVWTKIFAVRREAIAANLLTRPLSSESVQQAIAQFPVEQAVAQLPAGDVNDKARRLMGAPELASIVNKLTSGQQVTFTKTELAVYKEIEVLANTVEE